MFREAIAFEKDGVAIAGNKLGKAYSFPGLLKYRGVSYDPERDMPALVAAAAGKMVELEKIEQPTSSNQFEIPAGIQKSNPTPQSTTSNHFQIPAGIQKSKSTPQPTQPTATTPQKPDPAHHQLVGNLMSLVDRELKRTKTNQSSGQTWEVWQEDEHHLTMRRHSDGLELQAIYKDAQWQPVELPPLSTRDVQALKEFTQKLEQWLREREIEQKKEQKRQKKKQRQLEL